jgi:hypothetical protein
MPELCRAIDLKTVPHFITLHKASQRLLAKSCVTSLLAALVKRIPLAALDTTDLESGHISPYF